MAVKTHYADGIFRDATSTVSAFVAGQILTGRPDPFLIHAVVSVFTSYLAHYEIDNHTITRSLLVDRVRETLGENDDVIALLDTVPAGILWTQKRIRAEVNGD